MFSYSRLQIEIELLDDNAPSGYWGTKLRGGLGTALKQILCAQPGEPVCMSCPQVQACLYPPLFKPHLSVLNQPLTGQPLGRQANLPPPFVISPPVATPRSPRPGSRYGFELILFGEAQENAGYILAALESFGRYGLENGTRRAKFKINSARDALAGHQLPLQILEFTQLAGCEGQELSPISLVSEPILRRIQAHRPAELPQEITLNFVTPVRREIRKALRRDPASGLAIFSDAYELLSAVTERIAGLWQLYDAHSWSGQTEYFKWRERILQASRRLQWLDDTLRFERHTRFSSVQNRRLEMDGFRGSVTLVGDLTEVWELLWIGAIVHIGAATSQGYGRYVML